MADIVDYLTIKEAADLKGVSYEAIRQAVDRGDIESTKIGVQYFILPGDLRRYKPNQIRVRAGKSRRRAKKPKPRR